MLIRVSTFNPNVDSLVPHEHSFLCLRKLSLRAGGESVV